MSPRWEFNLISQPFKSSNQLLLEHLVIALIEVVAPQIQRGPAVAQERVDNDQDAMADRDGSTLGSTSSSQATVLRRQRRVLAVSGSVGGLDQEPTGVRIAFACLA